MNFRTDRNSGPLRRDRMIDVSNPNDDIILRSSSGKNRKKSKMKKSKKDKKDKNAKMIEMIK